MDEALEDKSVPISDKLRKLLTQFSVMRHEDKHDMLLPKGKSFYNQVGQRFRAPSRWSPGSASDASARSSARRSTRC